MKTKTKANKPKRVTPDEAVTNMIRQMGEKVRSLRQFNDMSLADLAGKVGITRGYLSHVELGRYEPSITVIYKLALALDVPLTDLIVEPEGNATL